MSKPTKSDGDREPVASSEQVEREGSGRSNRRSGERGDAGRDGYVVRPYRSTDRERFLRLYDEVFGESRTGEWFDWRYGGPYVDRPRMIVAERDGDLVGAEPFISLGMRAADETALALQPADAMVHPDHRRNGLLTRMTERALDYFADREPSFVFNFPNEAAKGAYLKLGWIEVGTIATAYRVQNPSAFFRAATDGAAGSAADAGASAFHRVRDAVAAPGRNLDVPIDVRRRDGVPAEELATLYESAVPDRIHTPRTREFLEWRYANPNWDVSTYAARRGGEIVAAIVTVVERTPDLTTAKVLDAFPLDAQSDREDALAALLAAAVNDAEGADVVTVADDTLPSSVLSTAGFYWDDRPPLSLFGSLTTVVARPLAPDRPTSWSVGDRHLPERRDWRLPFAEQDCST